ncbi:hypothetical protein RV10_GL002886 [Enterococcus pallens]|nr:hypothetical protein RV10_GL002886 [Enterococcus pallens]
MSEKKEIVATSSNLVIYKGFPLVSSNFLKKKKITLLIFVQQLFIL